ncbi:guanylate kinase [Candidatus Nitrosacidococcus tergens]|uniref:Guanylate kinase n=1 Tax=Candidatus Nitrosacidococcus tergens TaxID=553981 RepID=A0A7G1QAY5_9GAMM|nr:guanylate kinase [Candidatus Nitrosacidococcus tergens]CAB1277011.1 guanylate kinase [Candidatus Nitrosacidococcus tergens]
MLGKLFVISAPSGAGKTSLVKGLISSAVHNLCLSISHTTRPPRLGEQDGVDYHFVSEPTFQQMVHKGDFLEHAQVFSHNYGTAYKNIHDQLAQGKDVLLEIDWQGARQVRSKFPDTIGIFILPPSKEKLNERLHGRGQDSEAVINQRMESAYSELSHYKEFDYLIVNDQFDLALEEFKSVVISQRLQSAAQEEQLKMLLIDLLR